MNSVTGESGPVSIDRPRPAVSHEVPGRVERPGPVTPPVGLEGARAPCGGVAFANGRTPRRPHVMHVLDDEPHAPFFSEVGAFIIHSENYFKIGS